MQRFSKAEELETLKGNWESAKAAANGHEEVLRMDLERMDLAEKEMEQCIIKAPRAGLVIYPKQEDWKQTPDIAEGVTVHHDQSLLLMPDLSQMQAKVGIHQSMVDHVKPGMIATVTLPDQTLTGKVKTVASAARPAGWWTGNTVKYDAVIELPSAAGLKPGMSAGVEIILSEHADVLQVPLTAVVDTVDGPCCWVGDIDQNQKRPVQLGASSDSHVVVEDGLQVGETVLLNPLAFIDPDSVELTPESADSKPFTDED